MSSKAWIIFSGICLVVLGGLVYLSAQNKIDVSSVNVNAIQAANVDNGNIADHVFGNAKSKVVIVEYGDYQCPGCGSAYPIITPLMDKYKDQVAFVFRNFPLTQLHPNAMIAAAAAEAAGLQGKYWEMHDKIYKNQSAWNTLSPETRVDFFVSYAKDLNLNADTFKTDLTGSAVTKKIAYDQAIGKKAKVASTPTFILNGTEINKYVKDGKIVDGGTAGANPIWSDADSFEKLIILPALKEHGIAPPATATAN